MKDHGGGQRHMHHPGIRTQWQSEEGHFHGAVRYSGNSKYITSPIPRRLIVSAGWVLVSYRFLIAIIAFLT